MDPKALGELLVKQSYISQDDLTPVMEAAQKSERPLEDYLVSQGLITRDVLGQAIAETYGIPYANLGTQALDREQVLRLPEELARKFNSVVYLEDAKKMVLASSDPAQPGLLEEIKKHFAGSDDPASKKEFSLTYAFQEDIERAFVHYRKPLETRFAEILRDKKAVAPTIIDEILHDAYVFNASDLHFEPEEQDVVIRFRIDGVLQEAGHLPLEVYENILNRIKVWAKLRIDEHFSAQDGGVHHTLKDVSADLRISIVPTINGEKIAIRILASYVQGLALSDLGLSSIDQDLLTKAAGRPFGMILVTGPTGSGKSTTSYAILKILNKPWINTTTIEDPAEYRVPGVNQIQVNQQTNLTFAKGLRSIVRQDPDIIFVGEIRDTETAEIAVNAALTGHLLLSTFHANDAPTAIPRLLDMKIEPFLLASTLELIIAQRLVRKICTHCRYSVVQNVDALKTFIPNISKYITTKEFTMYLGKGCKLCNHTGFKGRTAVFELITNSRELKDLIMHNPSTQQVWELARKQGARTMFEDGVEKVKNGVTTFEELLRVASPPEDI
jgi:type IV pilus assembly protein PilB